MKWEDVRNQYPDQWIVFEALQAHTDQDTRYVDELAVIDRFSDSRDAMRRHHELHKANLTREYYFFHTSRVELQIIERKWSGIRGLR